MKKPKVGNSVKELAEALDVSQQLIRYHRRNEKAPPLNDREAWVEFLATVGREGSVPKQWRGAIAKQRHRLLKAQAEKAELENQVTRKEVIAYPETLQFINALINQFFFSHLDRMSQYFPSSLKGKTEVEINKVVEDDIEKVRQGLRRQLDIWEGKGPKS